MGVLLSIKIMQVKRDLTCDFSSEPPTSPPGQQQTRKDAMIWDKTKILKNADNGTYNWTDYTFSAHILCG